ncbi:MAG: PAS domain S-box protein, partial [Parasporobacterium sp.]|nr:PAS domain S-box protein [Parasporobacterium sp.]
MTGYLTASFAITMLGISVVYLYVFTRKQEYYIRYWCFAWIAYCFSLFCLMLYSTLHIELLIEIRILLDMTNIIFILFGTYSLIHMKIPTYWFRFMLYMVLLALVCMVYELEFLSYYLPAAVFQTILIIFAGYNLFFKWNVDLYVRAISSIVVIGWGLFKSVVPIMELFIPDLTNQTYVVELMFSNILNITILILFIFNMQHQNTFSKDIYRNLVENSREVVFYYQFKPFVCFRYINTAVTSLTGYPRDSFYADPRLFINIVEREHSQTLNEVFDRDNMQEGSFVFKIIKKGDEERWIELTRSIVTDEGDPETVKAILGTMRDITEVHNSQMEQINLNKSRNMLLSYISHELRTPITSIAGYLTAINDGVITGEDDVNEAYEIITN